MPAGEYHLHMLGEFGVFRSDRRIDLASGSARLIAFLGCRGRSSRETTGELLWPALPEGRARANLRSAMWRLQRACPGLLASDNRLLALAEPVRVDLLEAFALGRGLIESKAGVTKAATIGYEEWSLLAHDVLPEWAEEWVLVERERFRQLRLHGLEQVALAFISQCRFPEAIEVAETAIQAEPLRESAYRLLIMAHQGEGNHGEAMRAYKRCSQLIYDELGLAPTPLMEKVVVPSKAQTHPSSAVRGRLRLDHRV
ncbi:AfsR/SARP family transcriptional regulator [Microbispora bryophytorum]|uniref:AfsR/SARP family transcriptional regulator n=1 Tax=Microbispora bryophytorum TaxID=1460882 RepID=UPI0033E2DC98